jgi:hypothetical protein
VRICQKYRREGETGTVLTLGELKDTQVDMFYHRIYREHQKEINESCNADEATGLTNANRRIKEEGGKMQTLFVIFARHNGRKRITGDTSENFGNRGCCSCLRRGRITEKNLMPKGLKYQGNGRKADGEENDDS